MGSKSTIKWVVEPEFTKGERCLFFKVHRSSSNFLLTGSEFVFRTPELVLQLTACFSVRVSHDICPIFLAYLLLSMCKDFTDSPFLPLCLPAWLLGLATWWEAVLVPPLGRGTHVPGPGPTKLSFPWAHCRWELICQPESTTQRRTPSCLADGQAG